MMSSVAVLLYKIVLEFDILTIEKNREWMGVEAFASVWE